MGREIEIRRLRPQDERSSFRCGDASLDRFFRHYAGQNQFKLKLAVIYVAVLGEQILGFATVAAGSVEKRTLPTTRSRRRLPDYPLPILRLARLGVQETAQGAGIGRQLLRHVLCLALAQVETSGCVGVITDAKANAVSFYETLGFIRLRSVREGRMHGDPTPMFLDIDSIKLAVTER